MEFSLKAEALGKQKTGCIVAGVFEGGELSPSAAQLDAASGGFIRRLLQRGDLRGEAGNTLLLHDVEKLACERVLLVGLGPRSEFRERGFLQALSAAMKALQSTGAASATMCLSELPIEGRDSEWTLQQGVLAAMDAAYRFDKLKSKPPRLASPLKKMAFQLADDAQLAAGRAAIARAAAIGEGIQLTKDLGNMPGNLCTPTYLAQQAKELGKRDGFKVTILGHQQIEKLGMGAFLAVARGSRQPPKLIVMEYRGAANKARRAARKSQPVVLVGKGITFDAGGISIKPALEMDEMKFDMCGAASVFGALHAAALMKLPLDVVGIVPATENMPGDDAVKPGDIVKTMSGKTVEILDTDSEGRLVLCDALAYARKFNPSAVVDIATLTGEIVVALGEFATGLFSNDDALAREVLAAGDAVWDRAWQMPLWDDYQEALKSNFADLPNIGSRNDCAVTAACFLSRFTSGYSWAHLDIAGTASKSGADKGATGRPVALLAQFLSQRAGVNR